MARTKKGTGHVMFTVRRDSLPLDGSRRLRCDVEYHPVDLRTRIRNASRDLFQHVVRDTCPVRSHGVLARHRAKHNGRTISTPVTLYPYRMDITEEDDRALPYLAIQARGPHFLTCDGIGSA
mgnify:CR=1 FL=1